MSGKSRLKILPVILLVMLASFFLAACKPNLQKIEFDNSTLIVAVNTSTEFTYKLTPDEISHEELKFTSTNSNIAIVVENKYLLAKSAGTVRIYAEYQNIKESFEVIVQEGELTLQKPTGLRYDNQSGKIVWNAVGGATKYEVVLNDVKHETSNLFYDSDIILNSLNNVKVKAVKDEITGNTRAVAESEFTDVLSFKKLSQPSNVKFDKATNKLSWDSQQGIQYRVGINDVFPIASQTENFRIINFPNADDYYLSVMAVENENVTSTPTEAIKVTKLAAPETPEQKDDLFTWKSVEGALKYRVFITDGTNETFKDVITNQVLFSELELGDGNLKLQVIALGEGNFILDSDRSEPLEFVSLPKVTNLAHNKNVITWDAIDIENITYKVIVKLNGIRNALMSSEYITATSYTIPNGLTEGSFEVIVQAEKLGLISLKYSSLSFTLTKTQKPEIQSFNESAKTFTVLTSDNTDNITVYINGNPESGTAVKKAGGFEFILNSLSSLTSSGEYSVTVIAGSNEINLIDSDFSDSYNITRLAAPVLSVSGGILVFTETTDSFSYDLFLSDDSGATWETINLTELFYKFDGKSSGAYAAKIQSVGNGDNILSSALSIEFNVIKLAKPTLGYNKTENEILFSNQADNSVLYITKPDLSKDTKQISGSSVIFNYSAAGVYSIEARNLGDNVNLITSSAETITLEILKDVTAVNFQNNASGKAIVTFSAVANADDYLIFINGTNVLYNITNSTATTITVDLGITDSIFDAEGQYIIEVFAVSSENNIINSAGKAFTTNRLPMITTVSVSTAGGLFVVWNQVEKAVSYQFRINGGQIMSTTLTQYDISALTKGEYLFEIVAYGNNTTLLSSINYKQFTFTISEKIAAATGLQFVKQTALNEAELTFNKVEFADSYKIYVGEDEIGTVTATGGASEKFIFPHDYFESKTAGIYNIRVITVPVSGQYLENSNFSSVITVEKLSAPTGFTVDKNEKIDFTKLSPSKSTGYQVLSITDIAATAGRSLENLFEYDGYITIRVKNIGYGDYNIDSDVVTFNISRLDTPFAPYLSEDVINWHNAANTANYRILLKSETLTLLNNDFASNILSYAFDFWRYSYMSFTVTVQSVVAEGQNQYLSSRVSAALAVTKLNAPDSLEAEIDRTETTILWNHDTIGVTAYRIYQNGILIHTTANGLELSCVIGTLTTSGEAEFYIVAIGNNSLGYIKSDSSTSISIKKLYKPSNIRISQLDGILSWDAVADADTYYIDVYYNDQEYHTTSLVPSCDLSALLIELQFIGRIDFVVSASKASQSTGRYIVDSEGTTFSANKIAPCVISNDDFAVIVTNDIFEGKTVKSRLFVERNSVLYELTLINNRFVLPDDNNWLAGTYKFVAYSYIDGSTTNFLRSFSVTETYIRIDSIQKSGNIGTFFKRNGNDQIELYWQAVTGAVRGYEIYLSVDNGEIEFLCHLLTCSLVLDALPSGNLTFYIFPFGDIIGEFAGQPLVIADVYKMTNDFDLRNNNGIFYWTFVEKLNAVDYIINVTAANTNFNIPADPLKNKNYDELTGIAGGLSIKMKAVGNITSGTNANIVHVILDSNYTLEKYFHKLAKTPLTVNKGEFKATATEGNTFNLCVFAEDNPNVINTYNYDTYSTLDANSFYNFVRAGRSYKAFVIAKRAGDTYLNSDPSDEIFFKIIDYDSYSTNLKISQNGINELMSKISWNYATGEVSEYKIRVMYNNMIFGDFIEKYNNYMLIDFIGNIPGNFQFSISATGNSVTDMQGYYWLSSRFTGRDGYNSISAYKLMTQTLSLFRFWGVELGTLTWSDMGTGVLKYNLYIDGSLMYSGTGTSFEIGEEFCLSGSNCKVTIASIGNGEYYLSSELSDPLDLYKLKKPGDIIVSDGGFKFESETNAYDTGYEPAGLPTGDSELIEFINKKQMFAGYIEMILFNTEDATKSYTAYIWPELLINHNAPFAGDSSKLYVYNTSSGPVFLNHVKGFPFSLTYKNVSYFGIDDIFPNIEPGSYTLKYRQMGDFELTVSSGYKTIAEQFHILASASNVKIETKTINSLNTQYLTWSPSAVNNYNSTDNLPEYLILAFNKDNNCWDYLITTKNTYFRVDNSTSFDGTRFFTSVYTKFAVMTKGNTKGLNLANFITSPRKTSEIINIEVVDEITQFGTVDGRVSWNSNILPRTYRLSYRLSGNQDFLIKDIYEKYWDMAGVGFPAGTYEIKIQAMGDETSVGRESVRINSKATAPKNFTKLAPLTATNNLKVERGFFTWNYIKIAGIEDIDLFRVIGSNNNSSYSIIDPSLLSYSFSTLAGTNTAVLEFLGKSSINSYFKFQYAGSKLAGFNDTSIGGYIASDFYAYENNTPKQITKLEPIQGNIFISQSDDPVYNNKICWKAAEIQGSEYINYFLTFTQVGVGSPRIITEYVNGRDAANLGYLYYTPSSNITPGNWKVSVKATNSTTNLISDASPWFTFTRLEEVKNVSVKEGYVNWSQVNWGRELTDCFIMVNMIRYESSLEISTLIYVIPNATKLDETTVLPEYLDAYKNLPVAPYNISVKTTIWGSPDVLDSAWSTNIVATKIPSVNVNNVSLENNNTRIKINYPEAYKNYFILYILYSGETEETKTIIKDGVSGDTAMCDVNKDVVSVRIQAVPNQTNPGYLASGISDIIYFVKMPAPERVQWDDTIQGFRLNINTPLSGIMPNNYTIKVIYTFIPFGQSDTQQRTESVILQKDELVFYPIYGSYRSIKYAVVVNGIEGEYSVSSDQDNKNNFNLYQSGTGTASDPFIISTAANFANIQYRSWMYFKQGANLTISVPLSKVFTGNYDGNGYKGNGDINYTITLNFSTSAASYVGLFSEVGTNAQIKNVVLKPGSSQVTLTNSGSNIYFGFLAGRVSHTGSGNAPLIENVAVFENSVTFVYSQSRNVYIGGLVGYMMNGVISNCVNSCSMTFTSGNNLYNVHIAGIAGYTDSSSGLINISEISGCVNKGNITSVRSAGIVYTAYNTNINYCANKGKIIAEYPNSASAGTYGAIAAGISAYASGTNILSCYNIGEITVNNRANQSLSSYAAGIVAQYQTDSTMANCYNAAKININSDYASVTVYGGNVYAFNFGNSNSISNCYYLENSLFVKGIVNTSRIEDNCTRKTDAEMKNSAFITNLGSHYIFNSGSYPLLTHESVIKSN